MMPFSSEEIDRWMRQMVLPEWGAAGQEKIRAARVAVHGSGPALETAVLYLRAAGARVDPDSGSWATDPGLRLLVNGAPIEAQGDRVATGAAVAVEALKAILGLPHRSEVSLDPA